MNQHPADHTDTRRVAAGCRSPSPPGDAPPTRGQKLAREAADAAEVRAYETDPDVVAYRIERIRAQVDRLCWAGIVLGLAFTMTNVQAFAARGAPVWSLPWLAAWLLDPTVSLVLLAILRAEQVTARYQVQTGPWVRRAKWFTLAATYVRTRGPTAGSAAGIVLHSVPPLLVFTAAEAVTDLRDKLTEATAAAFTEATQRNPRLAPVNAVDDPDSTASPAQTKSANARQRKSFDDYLAAARAAWTPDVAVTPAWVRQATGCSRGLSSRLATALATEVGEHRATQRTNGDGS